MLISKLWTSFHKIYFHYSYPKMIDPRFDLFSWKRVWKSWRWMVRDYNDRFWVYISQNSRSFWGRWNAILRLLNVVCRIVYQTWINLIWDNFIRVQWSTFSISIIIFVDTATVFLFKPIICERFLILPCLVMLKCFQSHFRFSHYRT